MVSRFKLGQLLITKKDLAGDGYILKGFKYNNIIKQLASSSVNRIIQARNNIEMNMLLEDGIVSQLCSSI